MNFKELTLEVEKDLKIEPHTLDKKVFEIPSYFNKYLRLYTKNKIELNKLKYEFSKLYSEKYHEYKFEYKYALSSMNEIKFYVEGNKDIIELLKKVDNKKSLVEYLEKVVKKCEQLSFDVKNIIENQKYFQGV